MSRDDAGRRDAGPGPGGSGVYAVDVTVSTHDALRAGVIELGAAAGGPSWHRVLISGDEAGTDRDAVLLAAQMAAATGGVCTSAVLVSWPGE